MIIISTISSRVFPNTSIISVVEYEVVLLIVNRNSFFNQIIKILYLYSGSNQFLLNLSLKSSPIIRYQYRIVLFYLISILLRLNGVFSRRLLLDRYQITRVIILSLFEGLNTRYTSIIKRVKFSIERSSFQFSLLLELVRYLSRNSLI